MFWKNKKRKITYSLQVCDFMVFVYYSNNNNNNNNKFISLKHFYFYKWENEFGIIRAMGTNIPLPIGLITDYRV